MINQNSNITADNIIEEIAKQVKHYSEEHNYGFRYGNTQCFFELYINETGMSLEALRRNTNYGDFD